MKNDFALAEQSQNAPAYSKDEQNTELIKKLALLLGLWKGEGVAQFPTIITCPYLEELRFESNGEEPAIHFEQKTWVQATGAPLHWESGFYQTKRRWRVGNSQCPKQRARGSFARENRI